jgi:hypothetical protein
MYVTGIAKKEKAYWNYHPILFLMRSEKIQADKIVRLRRARPPAR